MDELEKQVVEIFAEEHEDWVKHLKEAETSGEGIDINLGGGFARRMERLIASFREYRTRMKKKKKGLW